LLLAGGIKQLKDPTEAAQVSLAEFKWLLMALKPVYGNFVGTFSLQRATLRYNIFIIIIITVSLISAELPVVLIVYFPWRSKAWKNREEIV